MEKLKLEDPILLFTWNTKPQTLFESMQNEEHLKRFKTNSEIISTPEKPLLF